MFSRGTPWESVGDHCVTRFQAGALGNMGDHCHMHSRGKSLESVGNHCHMLSRGKSWERVGDHYVTCSQGGSLATRPSSYSLPWNKARFLQSVHDQ